MSSSGLYGQAQLLIGKDGKPVQGRPGCFRAGAKAVRAIAESNSDIPRKPTRKT